MRDLDPCGERTAGVNLFSGKIHSQKVDFAHSMSILGTLRMSS
jgi:hypothetical protein